MITMMAGRTARYPAALCILSCLMGRRPGPRSEDGQKTGKGQKHGLPVFPPEKCVDNRVNEARRAYFGDYLSPQSETVSESLVIRLRRRVKGNAEEWNGVFEFRKRNVDRQCEG